MPQLTDSHSRSPRPVHPGALPSMPPASSWNMPKRMIWTGAFAAVTIVCSIYGAGLKAQQEYRAEKKKIIEAPPEERIRELEARRAKLMTQRRPLEQKLEELRLRIEKENESNGRS